MCPANHTELDNPGLDTATPTEGKTLRQLKNRSLLKRPAADRVRTIDAADRFRRIVGVMVSVLVLVQLIPQALRYPGNFTTLTITTPFPADASTSNDFELALNQSYGFFDNIASADWKLYQKRAREHQNHADPNRPNGRWPSSLPSLFYMNNYDPFFTCAHIRRVGGGGDGPKWTCDPHRLTRVAHERRIQSSNTSLMMNGQSSCLVYSIGCAGNYQWEIGLAQILMGPDGRQRDCEIHVFDFSGNFTREGYKELYNIHFHQWGLKSSYDDTMEKAFSRLYKPDNAFTIEQLAEKLGHTGHVIDILKIDCEFCEWFSYKDWLSSKLDIRQLLIETHNLPTPAENPNTAKDGHWFPASSSIKPNDFFDAIEAAGFAMYSKEPNIHPNAQGNGVEFAYIKLHPDFFRTTT